MTEDRSRQIDQPEGVDQPEGAKELWSTEGPEPELKPGLAPKKAPKTIDAIQRGLGVVRRRVLMNRFLRNFF